MAARGPKRKNRYWWHLVAGRDQQGAVGTPPLCKAAPGPRDPIEQAAGTTFENLVEIRGHTLPKRAQYPLTKEYTLNHNMEAPII